MLDGPDPSLQIIVGRKRAAMLLCELGFGAQWPEVQTRAAKDFSSSIERAAAHCEDTLDSVLSQRRKLKAAKLPLHKELGKGAFNFLQSLVPAGTFIGTQWSDVLRLSIQSPSVINKSRSLARLAEKGDEKLWTEILGQDVVLWAPADNNTITRVLSQFLRRTSPESRPTSICLIVSIPLKDGMHSVDNILDLWHTPTACGQMGFGGPQK